MIEIKELSLSLFEKEILQDINITIKQGEICTLVGQSGSGKSVLMKTVEGLFTPQKGSIMINDKDMNKISRKQKNKVRRSLAMLFQDSALLDSLNVFQNVALPLVEHSNIDQAELFKKVNDCLQLVDLKHTLHKMPSQLSGGMKKRVALARAIILQPDYIIYDEPTTGLDLVTANEIIELIMMLFQEQKITPIIITHDFNCINKIKGRIIMLHDKRIIFDGSYEQFRNSDDKVIKKFQGRN
jgi:phospholipid/cholesterol/gamma-HCH transport system ATP-binding protein